MSRDFGSHKLRALERFEAMLRANLSTQLAAVLDAGLYAPDPDATAHYSVLANPTDLEKAYVNEDVAVYVYPAEPNSGISDYSGGATTSRHQIEWPVAVHLRFAIPLSEPFTAYGRTLTDIEKRSRISLRYEQAIINTVDQFVENGDDVLLVSKLVKNLIDTEYNDDSPDYGHVHTEWQITQMVERFKTI